MNALQTHEVSQLVDALSDWNHRSLIYAMNTANAFLRAAESISQSQLQAAHAARTQHEDAEADAEQPDGDADLARAQGQLMRLDVLEVARYWQDMLETMFRMQADLLCATGSLGWQPGPPLPNAAALTDCLRGSPFGFWLPAAQDEQGDQTSKTPISTAAGAKRGGHAAARSRA